MLLLLHIRTMTFHNAAARNDEDYIDWPEPAEDHPTMFYPEFPIFRFPKLYKVSGKEVKNIYASRISLIKGILAMGSSPLAVVVI